MNTTNPEDQPHSHWFDAAVFFVTVSTCVLLMSAACIISKPVETSATPIPELAMPQPPAPLELLPEPEPVPFQAATVPAEPVFGICWETPMSEASPEAARALTLAPPVADGPPVDRRLPFQGIIVQVADRYEVDPHLIRAIILAESGYNPRAKSKKGARGLMQLMPSTAKALGVQDIYDPEENIEGGVRYFRSLLDRFEGDVQLALAAYNAGSRHVRNYEGIPPFKATRHYVKKVLKFHEKFKMEKPNGFRRLA